MPDPALYVGGGVTQLETPGEQYRGETQLDTVEVEQEELVYVTVFPEQEYSGAQVQDEY